MRSECELLERMKMLYHKRLSERKEKFLSVGYMNCKHNVRHRVRGCGQLGFCYCSEMLLSTGRKVIVCNEDSVAKKCSEFCHKLTEEQVEEQMQKIIRDPSRCGNEYPKLAVLIWALQDGKGDKNVNRVKELVLELSELLGD